MTSDFPKGLHMGLPWVLSFNIMSLAQARQASSHLWSSWYLSSPHA